VEDSDAFPELSVGLSWHNPKRRSGKTKKAADFSAGMEEWNESRSLIELRVRVTRETAIAE